MPRGPSKQSKPIVDKCFAWYDEQASLVLDQTPIAQAIGDARNQRMALQRFLGDGRLPLHNNFSEREPLWSWQLAKRGDGGGVHYAAIVAA